MFNDKTVSIAEISMDGFQVVSGEMFNHVPRRSQATCTIHDGMISFSKMAIRALNNCERVRIEINSKKRCILLVPVTVKDKDGIRWIKNVKEPAARNISCKEFTSQLFELWKWDTSFVYRAIGEIVTADKKVMMLFDFSNPELWEYRGKE